MKRRKRRTQRFDRLAQSAASACRPGPGKSRWLPLHPLAPGSEWGPDLAILWWATGDVYQVVLRSGTGGSPRVLARRAPRIRRAEVHGLLEVRTGTGRLGAEVVANALAALRRKSIVARPGRRVRLGHRARRWSLADVLPTEAAGWPVAAAECAPVARAFPAIEAPAPSEARRR